MPGWLQRRHAAAVNEPRPARAAPSAAARSRPSAPSSSAQIAVQRSSDTDHGRRADADPRRSSPVVRSAGLAQTDFPALDVVIVSYRSRELTRNCLESLHRYRPRGDVRVFVVDNASHDGTVEMIGADYPDAELISSAKNLGFGRANNLAIREGNAPYVLLINPDARVTADALDVLLDLMESDPAVGMCGCRLELEDGTFDHAAKRSFPTLLGALAHFTGIGRRPSAPAALSQYRAPDVDSGLVEAINGAFMLIRREALNEVGLFDEGYWMYMEDLDLCYRFKQFGWLIWYEPRISAIHLKAGTSGKIRGTRLNYAFHYGMFRFYRKHYAPHKNSLVNFAVYAAIVVKLFISIVRNALRRKRPWTQLSTSRT